MLYGGLSKLRRVSTKWAGRDDETEKFHKDTPKIQIPKEGIQKGIRKKIPKRYPTRIPSQIPVGSNVGHIILLKWVWLKFEEKVGGWQQETGGDNDGMIPNAMCNEQPSSAAQRRFDDFFCVENRDKVELE